MGVVPVEDRLAALDGAESAIVLGSGNGAVLCTLLSLLRNGDHVLVSKWIDDATTRVFTRDLENHNVDVSFIDPTETRAWRRAARSETRAVFVALPYDGGRRLMELEPMRALTQTSSIALIIDASPLSPTTFRPLAHGADIVVRTAAARLAGDSRAVGGVVCGAEALIDEVRANMRRWSVTPSPTTLEALATGLDSLDARSRRQETTAAAIVQWARQRDEVQRVEYFGIASHDDHALASALLDGFGSTATLHFRGGTPKSVAYRARLRLFVAREESDSGLVSTASVAPAGALQLNIGLEDATSLIADLTQAME